MLSAVDSRIQQGSTVSPPLLLALLFGEYLDGKAERFRSNGVPWQQSIDAAVAEFMGETCPIVMITNRVGTALRDILSQQMRLKKIPGRRPDAFVSRHDFSDIIAYCRATRGNQQDVATQLDWWAARVQQLATASSSGESAGESETPQRKRKRRRRRHPNKKRGTGEG